MAGPRQVDPVPIVHTVSRLYISEHLRRVAGGGGGGWGNDTPETPHLNGSSLVSRSLWAHWALSHSQEVKDTALRDSF